MRLLLRRPVDSLGEPGDEVQVRAGYARNYLLPRRLALPVTEENRRAVAEAREVWAVKRVEERRAAEALAESLAGRTLRFERRVKTGSDELYGSVSVQDIHRELAGDGLEIPRNRIRLGHLIKTLGDSSVTVRLHPEVAVELAIEVSASAAASLGVAPAATIPVEPPGDDTEREAAEPDDPAGDAPPEGG